MLVFWICTLKAQSNQVIVQLKDAASLKQFEQAFDLQLVFEETLIQSLNVHLFSQLEEKAVKKPFLEQLKNHPVVIDAIENVAIEQRANIPNDPRYGEQWAVERIGMPDVWDITTGGTTINGDEIVIAIIDTDFVVEHEDLSGNIWQNKGEIPNNRIDDDGNGLVDDVHGWNFADNNHEFEAGLHGVPVQGIIGASGNNSAGIAGINWEVKMMLLQYQSSVDEIFEAYDYLLEQRRLYNETNGAQGAFVVSMNASWGLATPQVCTSNSIWNNVHESLGAQGILTAAAVKNQAIDIDIEGDIPSGCPSDFIVSVVNTDESDQRIQTAAFGQNAVDLGAPGDGIRSTRPFDDYMNFSGTSSATPHIAGSIGILYSLPCEKLGDLIQNDPPSAARAVKDALLNSVDKVSNLEGDTRTGGRLNVFGAVEYLEGFCLPEQEVANSFEIRSVSPVPASNILNVEYATPSTTEFSVKIFNSLGQLVYEVEENPCCFKGNFLSVDVSSLYSGAYWIVFQLEDDRIVKKIAVVTNY